MVLAALAAHHDQEEQVYYPLFRTRIDVPATLTQGHDQVAAHPHPFNSSLRCTAGGGCEGYRDGRGCADG